MKNSRILFLLTGVTLLGIALFSPEGTGYPFSLHMGRHLLLQLVVPPLLLLSLPAFDHGWTPKRPILNWLAGVGAMWFWHAPILCNAALRSPALEGIQVLTLFLAGTAFWWPIVGPEVGCRLPPLLGIVYLFTACLGCTVLGIIISFAPAGIYLASNLPGALNDWQFASPSDQRVGGLLMWVPGCLIYVSGIMGLMARWYSLPDAEPEGIS